MKLSLPAPEKGPPTEFRIFTAGKVETTKGTFIFDEEAAAAVMADYKAHGVELMIDYDHASLAGLVLDPAMAGKAAGWFTPELRSGELWATNVRWSPAAAQALGDAEWRYMSPAFDIDKDGRIISLCNVALTNLPATHNLDALVAASRTRDRRKLSSGPAFSDVTMAIGEALSELYPSADPSDCEGPWVQDVFDATVVFQLAGKLWEIAYSFDGAKAVLSGAPTEVVRAYTPVSATPAPAALRAKKASRRTAKGKGMTIEEFNKVCKALGLDASMSIADAMAKIQGAEDEAPADAPAGDDVAAAEFAPPQVDEPKKPAAEEEASAVAASVSSLMRLSGAGSFVDAVKQVEVWRESHLELETERTRLGKERATLEAAERRKGCIDLVRLGGRAPSTVWSDETATAPKSYLASMPIADFRAYVADGIKASGRAPASVIAPAAGGSHGLTDAQLAHCKATGCDPATFARLKAARTPTGV